MNLRSQHHTDLKTLVIGLGGQGLRRARAIQIAKGWQLCGICDSNPVIAQKAAAKLKKPAYSDIESAIKSRAYDVVVIATPPASHDNLISMALDHGHHVLCEKPLTIHHENARKLADKAANARLILASGFNHRFYAPVMDALNLMQSDAIGKVVQLRGKIGQKPDEQALTGWLGDIEISGGGVLTDNGSHLIDLVRLFMSDSLQQKNDPFIFSENHPGIELLARFTLSDNQGRTAALEASWLEGIRPYLDLEITGEKGTISLNAFPWSLELQKPGERPFKKSYFRNRLEMKFLQIMAPGLESSLWRELHAVRNSILGLDNPAMPHATAIDGAITSEIIHHLYDSNLGELKPLRIESFRQSDPSQSVPEKKSA